ncbi:MAG: hypothetical protein SFX18_02780 [Pirellulales bacterium]|nr:hypothetical protein [Pirellulales bacterium]
MASWGIARADGRQQWRCESILVVMFIHRQIFSCNSWSIAAICWRVWVVICLLGSQGAAAAVAGPILVVDYSYDTTGFFNDPQRREALTVALDSVNRWTDQLTAIVPEGGNTWTGVIVRPDTGIGAFLPGESLSVPANVIRVYVGARNLGTNFLASADRAFSIASGTPAWVDTVRYRGQAGTATNSDFSPWGGTITFNPNFSWYAGDDGQSIPADSYDLFTVAAHEMAHLLGFGTAESFNAQITNGNFTGPAALAVGSPNNPSLAVAADGDHWAGVTASTVAGQPANSLLNAIIGPGQRLRLTDLDAAVLDDLGWDPAIRGDADRDGDVDFEDMFTLVNEYGRQHAGWSHGDNDGDGVVGFADAFEATNNYGGGAGAISASSPVPEPAAYVAWGLAAGWAAWAWSAAAGGKQVGYIGS